MAACGGKGRQIIYSLPLALEERKGETEGDPRKGSLAEIPQFLELEKNTLGGLVGGGVGGIDL